jgi:hypothetical protein
LAYDFAALVATNEHGMPLVSDRFTVSEDAKGVWDYYEEYRYDVPKADVSSGSWECEPISSRAPSFGIRMPIYNFSEYWGVDGMAWLKNKTQHKKAKENPRKGPAPVVHLKWKARPTPPGSGMPMDVVWTTDHNAQKYFLRMRPSGWKRGRSGKTYEVELRPVMGVVRRSVIAGYAGKLGKSIAETRIGKGPWAKRQAKEWAESHILSPIELLARTRNNPESSMRFNPRNPNVRVRVGEIRILSAYPGEGDRAGEHQLTPEEKRSLDAAVRVADRDLRSSPTFNRQWNGRLFPYQEAGLAFALEQFEQGVRRTAIFDPMGLGKTPQGMAVLVALGQDALPAVIVAPNSAHSAWRGWARMLFNGPVLDGLPEERHRRAIYITNYARLQQPVQGLPALGLVIFDEAHELRNPYTAQHTGAAQLVTSARKVLMLTGTPAVRSPMEVLPLLQLLEHGRAFGSDPDASGQLPYTTAQQTYVPDRRDRIRVQRSQYEEGRIKAPLLYDFADPEGATVLEEPIRKFAARRSRRGVYEAKAAPPDWLPAEKQRSSVALAPAGLYDAISQQKLSQLPQPAAGEDDESEESLGKGLSSFAHLANARSRFESLVDSALRGSGPYYEQGQEATALSGLTQRLLNSDEARATLRAARRAYLPVPAPANTLLEAMGEMAIPHAVDMQQVGEDIAYVTPLRSTALLLGDALKNDDPTREVLVYSGGDFKGVFQGEPEQRTDPSDPGRGRVTTRFKPLSSMYRGVPAPERADRFLTEIEGAFRAPPGHPDRVGAPRGRSIVLTRAAQTGMSLPSAKHIVFLGRFTAPGLEDQMEDRINRATRRKIDRGLPKKKQIGGARAVYLIPDDIWGYALAHRLENRRRGLFRSLGERFMPRGQRTGDDLGTPLLLPGARQYADRVLRGRKPEDLPPVDRSTFNVLENYMFVEDPRGQLTQIVREKWKQTRKRREEALGPMRRHRRQQAEARKLAAERTSRTLPGFPREASTEYVAQEYKGHEGFKRYLSAIKSDYIVLWQSPRGRGFVVAQPEWLEDKNEGVYPAGNVARLGGDFEDIGEATGTDKLTPGQYEGLLAGAPKQNPRRRRRKRRSRWR